jgi:hypothetical protein
MKKILGLIYVCLLMTDLARGQEGGKTNVKGFGKLNSVNSAAEVEAIVAELDKHYDRFRVNTALSFADDNCFRLADLSKLNAITKADFDKNGFTDLLVIGTLGSHPVILSLMGSATEKIDMHIITKRWRRSCSIGLVLHEDGNTLIEFKHFNSYADVPDNEVFKSVKLAFKFGDFIEYNPAPKKYNIEKIEYKYSGVWIPGSAFSIEINSNRKGRYMTENPEFLSQKHNEHINFHGTIPDSLQAEIIGLLDYSDFPNLNDSYAVTSTDNSTGILKITFDGGKIKTIRDYGLIGTYSLNRIYQMMDSLKGSIVWKAEPSKGLIPLPAIK